MNSKQISIALGVIVVILLAVIGYILWVDNRVASDTEVVNINSNSETPKTEGSQSVSPKYVYEENPFKVGSKGNYDGQILEVSADGQKTVIVPSVKKAYGVTAEFVSLGLISQPTGSKNMYFHLVPNESDGAPWDLIRFNPATKKFTKLTSSTYYQGHHPKALQNAYPYIVSTYNPANPKDGQSLFLVDLEADKVTVAAKLPAGETLNYCIDDNCLGEFLGQIKWVDNNT